MLAVVSQVRHIIRGMRSTTDAPPKKDQSITETLKKHRRGYRLTVCCLTCRDGFWCSLDPEGTCNHHGWSIYYRHIFSHQAHTGTCDMKISFQYIAGWQLEGLFPGSFYTLGIHDGKQGGILFALRRLSHADPFSPDSGKEVAKIQI